MEAFATSARREILRELAKVRAALLLRQCARSLAVMALGASAATLLAVVFALVLPWLLAGSSGSWVLCALAGSAGAALGAWLSLRGRAWPSDEDCALALEHDAQGALPTAVGLAGQDQFAAPVLARAKEALGQSHELRLGAAVSTMQLILAPLLALCACVAVIAATRLPQSSPAKPAAESSARGESAQLRSTPTAADVEAYRQAVNERRSSDALKQAASDLRDEGKTDAERKASLDKAREEAARGKAASPETIPANVPASKAEREKAAARLEEAAAAAASRAEALEKGKGSATSESGGDVKPGETGARDMRPAPAYEPRRFDDAGQALSDQPAERRALAQAAVDALANIKQGR